MLEEQMMVDDGSFWDGLAEKYAAQPVGNPEAFERKIAVTKSLMEPSDVLLNIGCGTGSLALRLAGDGEHIHGLDISKEMLRIANEKKAAQQVENISFHRGTLDTFDHFGPESLDGICAYSILHLLEDRVASLAWIYSHLKPGGFFVSSTVCLGNTWIPYKYLLAVMKMVGKAPPVSIVSTERLIEEMTAAGFVDIEQPEVGAENTVAFITAKKPS